MIKCWSSIDGYQRCDYPTFLTLLFYLLQVKFAIQYMRRAIQKKAKFDIVELNTIKVFILVTIYFIFLVALIAELLMKLLGSILILIMLFILLLQSFNLCLKFKLS